MISIGVAVAVVGLVLLISFGFKTLAKGMRDLEDADTKSKGDDE